MDLKDRISKIIDYSKLSASEFADEIEVPRSSISHIAAGRNKPSLDFLVKVKSHFPNLEWDWLITGEGEMLKKEIENAPEIPQAAPTSLPDLFALIEDENFGKTEIENNTQKQNPQESTISSQAVKKSETSDSQRLEENQNKKVSQFIENQETKIKRIVLFFENGKFESFEAG